MIIEAFGKLAAKDGCKIINPYTLTYGRMMCFETTSTLHSTICTV